MGASCRDTTRAIGDASRRRERVGRTWHHGRVNDPRSSEQRRADALEKLSETHADAWVATASDHAAHLVPLSFAWNGSQLVLATDEKSVTARNLRSRGLARIALGTTRDVVMIEATLDDILHVTDQHETTAATYAEQADWDPRRAGIGYVYLLLRPQRVQVWREVNEIAGRTIMRAGAWVD